MAATSTTTTPPTSKSRTLNKDPLAQDVRATRFICTVFHPKVGSGSSREQALECFRKTCSVLQTYPLPSVTMVLERAPTTQKWHLQGCFSVKNRTTISSLRTWFLPSYKPHLEIQIRPDHTSYCLKSVDEDLELLLLHRVNEEVLRKESQKQRRIRERLEQGAPASGSSSASGSRRVREEMMEEVALTLKEQGWRAAMDVATPGFAMENLHKMKLYAFEVEPRRTFAAENPPLVIWIFGPTGSGKTRTALDLGLRLYGEEGIFMVPPQEEIKWFDGYKPGQHRMCLYDEFRESQVPQISQLLRMMDRYPLEFQVKGGFTHFKSELIVFTSDRDVRSCYSMQGSIDQALRRMGAVIYMGPPQVARLMTHMDSVCQISGELKSSWISHDSAGIAVSGTAQVYVAPASTESWIQADPIETSESPLLFDVFGETLDNLFPEAESDVESLPVEGEVRLVGVTERGFHYRFLKCDQEMCAKFGIKEM